MYRVLWRYTGALGHYRDPESASFENAVDGQELPGFTWETVGRLLPEEGRLILVG